MARAFRAASPLPLPSSRSATNAVTNSTTSSSSSGNFPSWLSKKRSTANKAAAPQQQQQQHGGHTRQEGSKKGEQDPPAASGPADQSSSSTSGSRKRADALARLRSAFLAAMAAYSTGALVREMSIGTRATRARSARSRRSRARGEAARAAGRADVAGLLQRAQVRVRRAPGLRRRRVEGAWAAVEPVSVGAGVLPDDAARGATAGEEGDLMYMRARFERVVGSRDSEAFYMMNPDGSGGPELSIYLLRV
ncbi:hypothetical protein PR202_gb09531 [Eleusine coracana subsp. coracana]|uniref:Protein MIZU-KUSSEI 1 n=1 Tax=Eleusine coracana subsp. coracana TaxID=191504 RepID=A0AAV5EHU3_ELECO|nr:hypothetical protein PR202_gb09531 [Eleusine coracana subsp. coracana]